MSEPQTPIPLIACPLCGHGAARFLFEKAGYRYFRCPGCTLLYSDLELLDPAELYDGYFECEWLEREVRRTLAPRKQAIYKRQIRSLVRRYRPGSRGVAVLDVGCGVGGFLIAARELGMEVAGVEVSEVAARYAREESGLEVLTACCERSAELGRRFDLIRINAVLEHLRFPASCLKSLRACLAPGGVVFGMTLNEGSWTFSRAGASWRYLGMGGHVTLFNPTTLVRFLSESGFSRPKTRTTGFREERRKILRGMQQAIGKLAAWRGKGHRLYFEATV